MAVVTVTYSPGEHLEHFITTLADATTEKPQVILADNGSTDGVPELVAEANSHVTLLHTGGNIGYGGAINRAVAEIDPSIEFVILAN
ncbi:glycosyltransferase family 2 protein, partial [Nocardia salmonicida]